MHQDDSKIGISGMQKREEIEMQKTQIFSSTIVDNTPVAQDQIHLGTPNMQNMLRESPIIFSSNDKLSKNESYNSIDSSQHHTLTAKSFMKRSNQMSPESIKEIFEPD